VWNAIILLLGTGAIQLLFEHYRWQLLPAYLLSALILFATLFPTRERSFRSPFLSTIAVITFSLFYILSLLLPILLPIPRLDKPSGPFAVGTRTWHWVDRERIDPHASQLDAPREILAQAWYPIDPGTAGEMSHWMASAEIVAPAVAEWIGQPSFFLDHLVLVETPALQDATIASNPTGFPVILFSHGFGGFRAQNTNQMLHLASHGFVVIAIEHTYAAVVTVFPDGHVAYHNPDTLPDGLPAVEDLAASRALGDQWANDLSFALDQLSRLNKGEGPLDWQGRLNIDLIGVFGHSTGGGATIEFCSRDSRCKAALTLDPFVKPISERALETGLNQPALHMFSEVWSSLENVDRFRDLYENSQGDRAVVYIEGSAHYDFSDLPLLSPLAHQIGLKGPINGKRMAHITNTYLQAHFEETLKGIPSELISLEDDTFPEVIFNLPTGNSPRD
jgi:dienelactone hydrolase